MQRTVTTGKPLTIGALAKAAGVNTETVRYYQRRGLLAVPPKSLNGYHHYPAQDVKRLRFIKRAQKLGFSLDEVANLLRLGEARCAETRELATHKLELIETRIADLERMAGTIRELVQRCGTGGAEGCPIVESLSDGEAG